MIFFFFFQHETKNVSAYRKKKEQSYHPHPQNLLSKEGKHYFSRYCLHTCKGPVCATFFLQERALSAVEEATSDQMPRVTTAALDPPLLPAPHPSRGLYWAHPAVPCEGRGCELPWTGSSWFQHWCELPIARQNLHQSGAPPITQLAAPVRGGTQHGASEERWNRSAFGERGGDAHAAPGWGGHGWSCTSGRRRAVLDEGRPWGAAAAGRPRQRSSEKQRAAEDEEWAADRHRTPTPTPALPILASLTGSEGRERNPGRERGEMQWGEVFQGKPGKRGGKVFPTVHFPQYRSRELSLC